LIDYDYFVQPRFIALIVLSLLFIIITIFFTNNYFTIKAVIFDYIHEDKIGFCNQFNASFSTSFIGELGWTNDTCVYPNGSSFLLRGHPIWEGL